MKLTVKAIISFILLISLVSAANTYSTSYVLKSLQEERLKTTEVIFAKSLAMRLYRAVIDEKINKITDILFEEKNLRKEKIEYIIVFDKKGYLLAHTFLGHMPKVLFHSHNDLQPGQDYKIKIMEDGDLYVYNIAVPIMEGIKQVGSIHIGIRSDYVHNIVTPTKTASHLTLLITLFIAIVAALIAVPISQTITNPLRRFKMLAEKISQGDLETKIDITSKDEIGDLATAFNKMTDDLHQTITSRNREISERLRVEEEIKSNYQVQIVLSNLLNVSLQEISLEEQLEVILQHILSIPWVSLMSKGAIFLVENDPEVLVMKAQHGLASPLLQACARVPFGRCMCGRAASSQRLEFANKIDKRHDTTYDGIKPHGHYCLPIMHGSSVLGVINLYVKEGHKRDEREERFLHAVANVLVAIIRRKQAEKQIKYLAYYDELTGLPNRVLFSDRLEQAIRDSRRYGYHLSVMFLDVDNFKKINDTLGHRMGDLLLQEVARRLTRCLRESDSISQINANNVSSSMARLGGDEFTILIHGMKHMGDTAKVAQRILAVMSSPIMLDNQEVVVSASIGISTFNIDSNNSESLLKHADTAMYIAKKDGRNNYKFFSKAMNTEAMRKLELENKLRKAIDRDEFILYYQPQFNVRTGRIFGLEALIRWRNPDTGIISPAEFIPLAEETGLILPISEWVLQTACEQNKEWQMNGFGPVKISVNMSGRQFRNYNITRSINKVLEQTGIDPRYLVLEITESIIMQNTTEIMHILNELSAMGLHLAMDDFGTGYSSLSYLKQFPLNTIKIDRSFVSDITNRNQDAAIVRAIIAMARSLELDIVAEGVETREQMDFLFQSGCDVIQGYYISEPLPAEEITPLMKKESNGIVLTSSTS